MVERCCLNEIQQNWQCRIDATPITLGIEKISKLTGKVVQFPSIVEAGF